jgi:hypothetical protein
MAFLNGIELNFSPSVIQLFKQWHFAFFRRHLKANTVKMPSKIGILGD